MRGLRWAAGLALVAWGAAGCGKPQVLQGTVVDCQAGAKRLVVKDERPPHAETAFSLEGADVGAEPKTGDVVRLAYQVRGDGRVATRVMNLTRQGELLKGKPK